MKAAAFDYLKPRNMAEALRALASLPGEAKPLAGGQSLGPMLNLRLARPKLLVDVSALEEFQGVEDEGDAWRIGASVTHAALEDRPLAGCAPLAGVARRIAYRAVRNRGTVGGSLAHADPAADWPLALVALGASIHVIGPSGKRELRPEAFMKGAFATALADDEMIESVRVPKLSAAARWGYYKFCRKTGEFPEAAAALLLDPERRIARLYAGALDRAPQPLEPIARTLAEKGPEAVTHDMVDVGLRRIAPGFGRAALRVHATAVRRAIAAAFAS